MSAVIAVSAIFFCGWWIYGGDWQLAVSYSAGPIAVYLLLHETNRKKLGSLETEARKWLEGFFAVALIGFLYTGGVLLFLAMTYFVTMQTDVMPKNSLLLLSAHFVPHGVLQGKRYWKRRYANRPTSID